MLGVVEVNASTVRYEGPGELAAATGATITLGESRFVLSRVLPGLRPIYYRVDYGRLELSDDLATMLARSPGGTDQSLPAADTLVGMVHGLALPPDATHFSGVRRLALGTQIRVDATGVTVAPAALPRPNSHVRLTDAIGQALDGMGPRYAIAYSGGLASAALALIAREGGQRPTLVHAEFDVPGPAKPVADVPGLTIERLPLRTAELLDHHQVSGDEVIPPLPEVHLAHQVLARIADAAGVPVVSGALLKDMLSVKLPEINTGFAGWRLLGCEPFHAAGMVRTLRQARGMVRNSTMHAVDAAGEVPEPSQPPLSHPAHQDDDGGLPGLTETGRQALQSARYSISLWRQQLNNLDLVAAKLETGIEERGLRSMTIDARLPAADLVVREAVAAMAPARLGRIGGGKFLNHLPLRELAHAHRVSGLRQSSFAARQRRAAARYLHQEREKIAAELTECCALADAGLIDPDPVTAMLHNGPILADHALPLLRMVWVDQWLKGRS